MIICELNKENAHDFLEMQLQLDKETDNMLFEPDERPADINMVYRNIDGNNRTGSVVFLVYEDEKCVGFLLANRGGLKRIRHVAYVVTGVLKDYQRKGIGNALFEKLAGWARVNGLRRLELTVMTHNEAGIALYKKHGFEVEGIKKCSMFVNGVFVDEYYMAKIFDDNGKSD